MLLGGFYHTGERIMMRIFWAVAILAIGFILAGVLSGLLQAQMVSLNQEQIRITAWPIESDLKDLHQYHAIIQSPSMVHISGNILLAELAELSPVPTTKLIWTGERNNRRSLRAKVDRVDKFAVPGIAAALTAFSEGINGYWKAGIAALGFAYPYIKDWFNLAAPPPWVPPADLAPIAPIPLDQQGTAGVSLYSYKDIGSVTRVIEVRR